MNSRYKFLLIICFLLSTIWLVYLFILQVFDPFNLTDVRMKRYDPLKEFIIADRGNIYDCNGELLVTSLKYYQIDIDVERVRTIANRNKVSDIVYFDSIAEIISKNSDLTHNFVYNRLVNSREKTIVISENINENQLLKIREGFVENRLNVMVSSFSSIRRVYTKDSLAARLLGITKGITDNATKYHKSTFRLEGLNGIERAFNNDLLGDYGWRKTLYDARQRIVPIPNSAAKPVTHGSSIYLTINSDIQEILENNLFKGIDLYKAKNAIGVIMNPKNGNIIAMAGINENDKKISDNQIRSLQNMPIQHMFEPGSTIKPFVSLMAIENDLFQEDDLIDCRTWRLQYNRASRTIRDTNELGNISFRDVIVLSSNVGIAKIAEKIGAENLYRGYLNFGFGTATNVDLSEESSGIFAKLSDWSNFSLHSLSFGQEMSVTALQLATAYSALANGGYLLKPNIIEKKIDHTGNVYYSSSRRVVNTVSNKDAIELNNSFLLDTVERGTATNTRFENIKIAGKTGTSEKAVSSGYSNQLRISSFAGFFPYDNPEYVIVIVYDEPEYRYRYGSQSAVPTFKKIVEEMLILPDCNIIPEIKMASQELITMPKLTGLKIDEAKKILDNREISYQIYNETPDSYVVHHLPLPGIQFGSKNTISIYCGPKSSSNVPAKTEMQADHNDLEMIMPNFVGLPLRQAIGISKSIKLNLSIEGSGLIVSQSIKAGSRYKNQERCVLVAR